MADPIADRRFTPPASVFSCGSSNAIADHVREAVQESPPARSRRAWEAPLRWALRQKRWVMSTP